MLLVDVQLMLCYAGRRDATDYSSTLVAVTGEYRHEECLDEMCMFSMVVVARKQRRGDSLCDVGIPILRSPSVGIACCVFLQVCFTPCNHPHDMTSL